jgi:spore coat protein CotH
MHERLAYWVYRQAGVPASRSNHLLLTVNGQFYGLYANVETVKKKLIGRWFADNAGPLFEGTDVDFAPQYVEDFELEAGMDDRTLIAGLSMALTMPSADAAITAAGGFADMDKFRHFWAAASVVGQFDALPYSMPGDDFYVYADPTSGRLAFLPWGMDETFYAGSFDVTNVYSVLARRCKESAACFQAYQAAVWEVQGMTEDMDLIGMRNHVMAQIAPYTAMDTRKPYTDQQVTGFQGALYWFITERRSKLNGMFN